MLKIGAYKSDSQVVLAPMAGVTDKPFRDLCGSLGTRLMIGEMVTSDAQLWATEKSRNRLERGSTDVPHWVQIAGGDPQMLAGGARMAADRGAQIIDINMGCPAKKVCRKAAGSALLKNVELVREILTAVVAAVDIPVTLKMRTGWSRDDRNGVTIARLAEDCGIAALSVHGRTRECGFSGSAEFDTIAAIKAEVEIPVIANGDIDGFDKADWVMKHTGADAIMIGRAAQGNPWLPGAIDQYLRTGIKTDAPCLREVSRCFQAHIAGLHKFYGEYTGVRVARKHLGWYLRRHSNNNEFRQQFNRIESAAEQIIASQRYFEQNSNVELAITQRNLAA